MKSKITLFWPTGNVRVRDTYIYSTSSAMCSLSKILEINNFDVTVIDSSFIYPHHKFIKNPEKSFKKLIELTENTNPDILGVGSWTTNMPFVAEFTREFKARNPNIPIILGGYNSTYLPNETLQILPHIDFLVRGEGEYTLLELCQKFIQNQSVSKVKGISFRNKERKIVHTPNRPLIQNLDELPLADLESHFFFPKEARFTLSISRGCSFNCSFCSIRNVWNKERFFSPNHIIRQMKHIQSLYPDIEMSLECSNFLSNVLWAKKVSDLVHKNFPDAGWSFMSRVDCISKEILSYLSKNNFQNVLIGIESIIPETITFLNKSPNPKSYLEKTLKVISFFDKFDITGELTFIIGTPNEKKADMLRTNDFIRKLKQKNNLTLYGSPLVLYPGTELLNMLKAGKISIYRISEDFILFTSVLFANKYKHVFMTPEYYRIKNTNMSIEEFEKTLTYVYNDIRGEIKHISDVVPDFKN